MMFPTIVSKQDHLVHIIKNEQHTECGFTYHTFALVNRTDLKQIKFIRKDYITCDICLNNFLNQK